MLRLAARPGIPGSVGSSSRGRLHLGFGIRSLVFSIWSLIIQAALNAWPWASGFINLISCGHLADSFNRERIKLSRPRQGQAYAFGRLSFGGQSDEQTILNIIYIYS